MTISPRTILWINHNFRWIAAGFGTLLIVIGYFIVLAPPIRTVFSTEVAGIRKLEEQQASDQARLDKAAAFVERYRTVTAEDVELLRRILPTEAQLPLLFNQIPALVTDAGMQLDSLSVAPGAGVRIDAPGTKSAVQGQSLGSVEVTLAVSDAQTYTDLQRFLDAVERNLRVFDIVSISFPTLPDLAEEASVEIPGYSVTMRTYYFDQTN